jgi:BioD-like phosphotransacetylase family protein
MKPVGQHYVEHEGVQVDEDVVLMRHVCGIDCSLVDMNPITVARGFTERYIREGDLTKYVNMIRDAYERISQGKQLMVIEGTGHAGVGSVFDLSNASVARILESRVILISTGGIGRPIDEIVMNKALFDQEGVEIVGVIINKVLPDKYEKIHEITRLGLERKGIRLLGVIPYEAELTYPTMEQIMQATGARVLYGEEYLQKKVVNILVAAMEPYHALAHFAPHSLIIVPGDREDIVLAVLAGGKVLSQEYEVSGIILTGGLLPHEGVLKLMRESPLAVLFSDDDTYGTTKKVHERRVKIRAKDEDKVSEACGLVREYVDLDYLAKL